MFFKKSLFSEEDKKRIVSAVGAAESLTNGEIRVCVVPRASKDIVAHAVHCFSKLGMDKTHERNGVLIMIAERDRKFAIIGDEGIHNKVKQVFWNDMLQILEYNFRQQFYVDGMLEVIMKIGLKLAESYPHTGDHTNELSNDIAYLK